MTRRSMLATAAAGSAALAAAQDVTKGAASGRAFFELRCYYMRNSQSNQVQRTTHFVTSAWMPAARRADIGPIGIFSSVIAPESPFLIVVSGYPSLAAMQTSLDKISADAEYQKALTEFGSNPELPYIRMESTLLRCFDSVPAIEPGPPAAGRAARTFELRTYESNTETTLQRKIKMFGDGEVAIFRKNGLQPVFFGEALVGPKLPRLTYMVAYENMAGREKAWAAFGADPDWRKLRAEPGLSDPEIVANISNMILKPVDGSEIR
jgi:hypothetical protein